jgi:dTDP-4-dehydrorhamnose 3,5-epimerase
VRFQETKLRGAFVVDPERTDDEREFFSLIFCRREFEARGLNPHTAQCSISFNRKRGTLRGMHYQVKPHEEAKLIRCTRGAIYDVILDLRPGSPTFRRWTAITLSAENRRMLYIPEGLAHGFQTLEDDSELFYHISEFYAPEFERGVRWNDPAFGFRWPISDPIMSDRDHNYGNSQ